MSYPTVKMKDITLIKTGKLDSNAAVDDGAYPFFTCDPNTLKINNWAYDTEAVLLAGNNASGNYTAKYYKGKFNAYQRVYIIETADPLVLNIRYLCYALNQQLRLLKTMSSGSTTKFLTLGMLHGLDIPLPSIKVQEQIVSVLAAYDDLIENNQKQIKLLEEAAQRLYREWFVDLRFPGHETTPITDGIPEGWEVLSMNDIAEYINGYAFKPTDWGTVGKPIIKIKEMGAGVTADTPRNTGEDIPEKYNVTAGDILFSWSATLSAMIWDEEDGLLNQHLFKVIPGEGISREFVLQSILKTLDEFSNLTTGSTMKHIQRGKLKEVKVNVPSTELIEQYRNISEPIREQILNIKRQMILLREARDRLLPKLMNGEIEV
jgi:type I restriction enzyme S subunit